MKGFLFIILTGFILSTGFSQVDSSLNSSGKAKTIYNPAISLENPVGGGQFGVVILGLSYQNRTRIARNDDANAAVYVGLGAPEKFIGAGVNINLVGLSNRLGEKNNVPAGSLDFHLNKFVLKQKLLLDIGFNNAVRWIDVGDYVSSQKSWYLSANYVAEMNKVKRNGSFSYISITAGLGNGYFRRDNNITPKSGSFDPFFSIATPLFRSTNIIAEWNGYDVAGGISIIPFQKFPAMLTLEMTDLIYDTPRMIASLSFPFTIKKSVKEKLLSSPKPLNLKNIRPVRTI